MRTLDELTNVTDPAWPLVRGWVREARNTVEVLPPSGQRDDVLVGLQVTTHSTLGAVAYETGGMFVDHGWLRVLGSGSVRLPRSLVEWNRQTGTGMAQGLLLVADDVVGGFFAINGGALGQDKGAIYYFAPDTLQWESTEKGYTDWLGWVLNGDLGQYYENLRWDGWEAEVAGLPGDRAIGVYPFLFTREGRDVGKASRKAVPVAELYGLYVRELAPQLGNAPEGTQFEVHWKDDAGRGHE